MVYRVYVEKKNENTVKMPINLFLFMQSVVSFGSRYTDTTSSLPHCLAKNLLKNLLMHFLLWFCNKF